MDMFEKEKDLAKHQLSTIIDANIKLAPKIAKFYSKFYDELIKQNFKDDVALKILLSFKIN